MESARVDNALARRQTQRALELLEAALNVLCETPAGNDNQLAPVTAQVYRARAALSGSAASDENLFAEAVVSCNQLLDSALTLAGLSGDLPSRQAQSLEAVARSQALLYPIARIRDHRRAKAPPRRSAPSPPNPHIDRRAAPRVDVETQVTYASDTNFFAGFAADLSDGGLFIATYNLQPIGTLIDISFSLPSGHIVNTVGQVRWLRDTRDENQDAPPGMGVMFQGLAREDRAAIVDFLQAREPLFYTD